MGRLEVFDLVSKGHRCVEGEDQVLGLQLTVRHVSSHFARALGLALKLNVRLDVVLSRTNLWQGLSFNFHRESDDVFAADSDELLGLGDFVLGVDNGQGNEEHHSTHGINGILELTLGRKLKETKLKGELIDAILQCKLPGVGQSKSRA